MTITVLTARTCQTCQHYMFSQDPAFCGRCMYPLPAWLTNSGTSFVKGWEGADCPLHSDLIAKFDSGPATNTEG